jgi:hypothetical protein
LGRDLPRPANLLIDGTIRYRYWYPHRWADGPIACWVLLNPSIGSTHRHGGQRPGIDRPEARSIEVSRTDDVWRQRSDCDGSRALDPRFGS